MAVVSIKLFVARREQLKVWLDEVSCSIALFPVSCVVGISLLPCAASESRAPGLFGVKMVLTKNKLMAVWYKSDFFTKLLFLSVSLSSCWFLPQLHWLKCNSGSLRLLHRKQGKGQQFT